MQQSDLDRQLGRTLDSIPFGWFHFWVIVVLALVGYTEGYDTALTGSLIVLAKQPLGLAGNDVTWLVVGPTAVLCCSMLVGSAICDRVSRKAILQTGLITSTLFTLAIPLARTPGELIALRMIGGIGFGLALPAAYPIGAEILPASHRKTFGWIYEIILAFAFTTIPFIGYLAGKSPLGWKLLPLPGGLMLFVAPLLVHFVVPESPRWHLSRGDARAAIDAVNRIIRRSGAALAPVEASAATGWSNRTQELPPYSAIFSPRQIRATLVASLVWTSALVSYYLFSFMLPKALVDQGFAIRLSFGLSSLLFFVTIPGKLLNGLMMEWIGRRWTISLDLMASVAGLLLMVFAHSAGGRTFGLPTSTVLFILGAVVTGFTVLSSFPAVRIYMTEQFPTNIRGRGYFFSEMAGRVVAGIAIPYLISGHTGSPVIFFGTVLLFSVMGAFVPIFLGDETVGQLELVTERRQAAAGRVATGVAQGGD